MPRSPSGFLPHKNFTPQRTKKRKGPHKNRGKRRVLLFAEIFCAVSDEEEDEEGEEEEGKKPLVEARQRSLRSTPPLLRPATAAGGDESFLCQCFLSARQSKSEARQSHPLFPSFHPFLAYSVAKKSPPLSLFPFLLSAFEGTRLFLRT